MNEKLLKAERTLEEFHRQKQENFVHQREMNQKRVLRAKIVNILNSRSPLMCEEYLNKFERTKIFNDKYSAMMSNTEAYIKNENRFKFSKILLNSLVAYLNNCRECELHARISRSARSGGWKA